MRSSTSTTTLAILQKDLLAKTGLLHQALQEGRTVEELKSLFTECSSLYNQIICLNEEEKKTQHP